MPGSSDSLKRIVKRIPVVRAVASALYAKAMARRFKSSGDYWTRRYEAGGNSGAGSYDKFAQFKAEILNAFVRDQAVRTVIEYGCGDGNQLSLADYPDYLGFDISPVAVDRCRAQFAGQPGRRFKLVDDYDGETAELTLSLDVVYHLVEDPVFEAYMQRLFDSSTRYVIVYASDTDEQGANQSPHVRHRHFTRWVAAHVPGWKQTGHVPNRFPHDDEGSYADFFIYEKE